MAGNWWDDPKIRQFGADALSDLGYGLVNGQGFGGVLQSATNRTAELQPYRDAQAEQRAAATKTQDSINQTVEWLKQQGMNDLVAGVESGGLDVGNAWNTALQRLQPKEPNLTADMQNFQFAQANPEFAAFIGGSGEAPQIVETYDPQTGQPVKGYMQGGTFVPVGGPKAPAARDNPMNATIQQAIIAADETAASSEQSIASLDRALQLSQAAYEGPFSKQRAGALALFGDQGAQATLELDNLVMTNALESLKATFGGAPTEGERQILLDIQGSVDQPKPVREAIYKRAQAAAQRRISLNRQKADAMRSGEYFDAGYGQMPAANTTSGGLSWSIEP